MHPDPRDSRGSSWLYGPTHLDGGRKMLKRWSIARWADCAHTRIMRAAAALTGARAVLLEVACRSPRSIVGDCRSRRRVLNGSSRPKQQPHAAGAILLPLCSLRTQGAPPGTRTSELRVA